MGYHTSFSGQFDLDRPLTPEHRAYLALFNRTRRMMRDCNMTCDRPDPTRKAVELPLGPEGGYFVGAEGYAGQEHTNDIKDWNRPPSGQPGLWCQWTPNEAGTAIIWDGGEKFYSYVEWLKYLMTHFLKPWGYSLTGSVEWEGEDSDDHGMIVLQGNALTLHSLDPIEREDDSEDY